MRAAEVAVDTVAVVDAAAGSVALIWAAGSVGLVWVAGSVGLVWVAALAVAILRALEELSLGALRVSNESGPR